jgi:hypothetical protein
MGSTITEPIVKAWPWLQPLIIAAVGSLAGAFAGAMGAQKIAERSKRRDDIILEIRHTNAAIMACFNICNNSLTFKEQIVKPLYDNFKLNLNKFEQGPTINPENDVNQVVQIEFHLQEIHAPLNPIETLIDIVYNKINCESRPLSLVQMIEQYSFNLNNLINKRFQLTESFKSLPQELVIYYYFGKKINESVINEEYPDVLDGIHSYLDNLIFFALLLSQDLEKHGDNLAERFRKEFDIDIPKINKLNFTKSREKGLMPSPDEYKDWVDCFKEQP